MQANSLLEDVVPALTSRLPAQPPATLDNVLDAASKCLARHGLRTSIADIARELGVVPSTVYRKIGSVENAAWLIAAREGHRFAARIPEIITGVEGARVVTAALAEAATAARAHPVCAKILADEPDFMGRAVTRDMAANLEQLVALYTPFLTTAVEHGIIRATDPQRLAQWLARIFVVVVLAPPPTDLRQWLDELLLPALEP